MSITEGASVLPADLSVDGVPAPGGLPEPERTCVLQAIADSTPRDQSVWAFNLSRRGASEVFDSLGQAGAGACSARLSL